MPGLVHRSSTPLVLLAALAGCGGNAPPTAAPAAASPEGAGLAEQARPAFLPGEQPVPTRVELPNAAFTAPPGFGAARFEAGRWNVPRRARDELAAARDGLTIRRVLPARDPRERVVCRGLAAGLAHRLGARVTATVRRLVAGIDTCAIALRTGGAAWIAVPLYSSTASWLVRCGFDPAAPAEQAECVAALATWKFSDPPADSVTCDDAARNYLVHRDTLDLTTMTERCETMGLDAIARACWRQAQSADELAICDMEHVQRRYRASLRRR